jgi:hypothetical protein
MDTDPDQNRIYRRNRSERRAKEETSNKQNRFTPMVANGAKEDRTPIWVNET